MPSLSKNYVYLYDTTLRDGAQTKGVKLTLPNKRLVTRWLDAFGFPYVEGGWPGANQTDTAFFEETLLLKQTTFTAFGMTRRPHLTLRDDTGFQKILKCAAPAACIVGKSWKEQAESVLKVSAQENLALITESMAALVSKGKEALFDAEHFFDGYQRDAGYALDTLGAALEGGASWLVLCDTNGGTLPRTISKTVDAVRTRYPQARLGFHGHNDMGLVEANSLEAALCGCTMIQGTLNGLGERCGNANLVTLIPVLLKAGFTLGALAENQEKLTQLSHDFDRLLDRPANPFAPFVGKNAYAHKAGLHVNALLKNPGFYEHTDPSNFGNKRRILMSDQAGLSNVTYLLEQTGFSAVDETSTLSPLLDEIKRRESLGYSFDDALGSFEILAHKHLNAFEPPFTLKEFMVVDKNTLDESNPTPQSNAHVQVTVGDAVRRAHSEGHNGPVHALDKALRKALEKDFPELASVRLIDYSVHIINTKKATGATTCVTIESENVATGDHWRTVGVSNDILSASMKALNDAYLYQLCPAPANAKRLDVRKDYPAQLALS